MPKRLQRSWSAALALLLSSVSLYCASLGGSSRTATLESGLAALRANDYDGARQALAPLVGGRVEERESARALLVLSASELDPRNPNRRLGAAAGFAARYLEESGAADWTRPVASSLYLLSLELGGVEERVAEAQEARQEAEATARRARGAVPRYTGQPIPARLRAVEQERDRLSERVKQLEQELERIRKTLRP